MNSYINTINESPITAIEFYASWCPHCQRMKPIVDELKRQLNGRAAIHLFDIDKHPQLAEDLDVEVTPTFIVYHNGNEVWRYEGEIDKDSLLHNIINPTE